VTRRRAGDATALVVLLLLVLSSLYGPGAAPRIGPLLDPVRGIWSVASRAELPRKARAAIPGLAEPVVVRYDDRGVPHVFAHSELDAVRALGYVVARDRLFQMELQARAGAGRLSELVGPVALRLDRETRELGLPDAARRRFEALPDSSYDRRTLEAFAEGVNGVIDALGARGIPLEYHLLDRKPERWTAIDGLYLFARMGLTLSLSNLEREHRAMDELVGTRASDQLLPRESPIQEPVQPNGRTTPRVDSTPLPPPGPAVTAARLRLFPEDREDRDEILGSNNWAVSPRRTAAGYALLAGDPHLDLTLPSIWYEAHLVVPDSLDVYGVTIPGAPGIVIGFTRDVAWSATNTEADVLDLYSEIVDQPGAPTRYRLDGAWHDLRQEVTRYLGRHGEVLAIDTLRFSHRGPLRHDPVTGRWVSVRWTQLEAGGEITSFSRAARAGSARAWLDTMATYQAPPQNFLVADRQGTIAIRSTGRFPIRPGGRGDEIQRGDTSAGDWTGDWPTARLPQAIDPAQGFLASANQQPIDPQADSGYLGADWYSPWRALRINQLLRADSAVTPDDMRRWQTDPGSPAADLFVPAFLAAARRFPGRDSLQRAATLLSQWNRRYTRDNTRAVLYDEAMRQMESLLWDELDPGVGPVPPRPAQAVVAARLLPDRTSPWWDIRETRPVEDRDAVLAEALVRALAATVSRYGDPDAGGWRWDRVRFDNIYHVLRIPALSALRLPVQGGPGTLNPSSGGGGFGPSWRMVVELGPEIRAWGIYPGGQSGNPLSRRYRDGISKWQEGQLDTLRFPRRATDLEGLVSAELLLVPPGSPGS
jgi:penicillin G amidase